MFKFKELINGIENLPKELLNYDSVVYRIHNIETNQNYIGTAKYGMPNRLYDGFHGHVNQYKADNKFKLRGMYHQMKLNIDNFELYIEEETSPENYDWILQKETELILKYDSVLFGYNVSIDGKPGWKEDTVCVNDGIYDLYIYQKDVERFCQNGWKLGSCKHNFLKGFIWINDGKVGKMINPKELDDYKKQGFKLGSIVSPNKDKIWVNNGKRSKLIDKDKFQTPELKDYVNLGRVEYPNPNKRKPAKTRLVNNGLTELRVLAENLDSFLKNNPEYKLGRIK